MGRVLKSWLWAPALWAVVLLSLSSVAAAAAITVVAPPDGAVLERADFIIAGKTDGSDGSLGISLNGKALTAVKVVGGFFSTPLSLAAGENLVELGSGSTRSKVTYEYRPGGGSGLYRFHAGYGEGECDDCHPSTPGKRSGTESALCLECHDRKDGDRYLHGPVGAGQCTFCHDPHGSSLKAFTTASGALLCVGCHDQPSSQGHMKSASGKSCEECHNPHGSAKKYFLY